HTIGRRVDRPGGHDAFQVDGAVPERGLLGDGLVGRQVEVEGRAEALHEEEGKGTGQHQAHHHVPGGVLLGNRDGAGRGRRARIGGGPGRWRAGRGGGGHRAASDTATVCGGGPTARSTSRASRRRRQTNRTA